MQKRTGGRKPQNRVGVLFSLTPELIERIDAEVERISDKSGGFRVSRSEMVRQLLADALAQRQQLSAA